MIVLGSNQNSLPLLKKPILTSKEYENALEEEEQTLDLLYDFYAIDAWLNHPVKRFKPDSKEHQRNIRWNNNKNSDLYSLFSPGGSSSSCGVTGSDGTVTSDCKSGQGGGGGGSGMNAVNTLQNFIKQEIKMEPGCTVSRKLSRL